jgi:cob(I)alamin adenosyltransferase
VIEWLNGPAFQVVPGQITVLVEQLNLDTLKYLNRLSDLMFVLARTLARQSGVQETYWDKGRLL